MESQFRESTIRGFWTVKVKGRIWRAWYVFKSNIRRAAEKATYRAIKMQNRPRVYRVEIR